MHSLLDRGSILTGLVDELRPLLPPLGCALGDLCAGLGQAEAAEQALESAFMIRAAAEMLDLDALAESGSLIEAVVPVLNGAPSEVLREALPVVRAMLAALEQATDALVNRGPVSMESLEAARSGLEHLRLKRADIESKHELPSLDLEEMLATLPDGPSPQGYSSLETSDDSLPELAPDSPHVNGGRALEAADSVRPMQTDEGDSFEDEALSRSGDDDISPLGDAAAVQQACLPEAEISQEPADNGTDLGGAAAESRLEAATDVALPDLLLEVPEVDPEILEVFLIEADEVLGAMAEHLSRLQVDPGDERSAAELRRASHTIKGSANVVGLPSIGLLGKAMENLLDAQAESRAEVDARSLHFLETCYQTIRLLLPDPANPELLASVAQLAAFGAELTEDVGSRTSSALKRLRLRRSSQT